VEESIVDRVIEGECKSDQRGGIDKNNFGLLAAAAVTMPNGESNQPTNTTRDRAIRLVKPDRRATAKQKKRRTKIEIIEHKRTEES
jgi:hypothetical protein